MASRFCTPANVLLAVLRSILRARGGLRSNSLRVCQWVVLAACVSAANLVSADQSAQTTPETYVSDLGRYRLTVFPLEVRGAFRSHSDLRVKTSQDAARASQSQCEATLERWVDNKYELMWRKPLVNAISPISALVSDWDGSFATIDDWSGPVENVVVIYSASGDVIKKFALRDLVPESEIEKFPHGNSSIDWHGHNIMDITKPYLILRIDNGGTEDKRTYRDLNIRLKDGSIQN